MDFRLLRLEGPRHQVAGLDQEEDGGEADQQEGAAAAQQRHAAGRQVGQVGPHAAQLTAGTPPRRPALWPSPPPATIRHGSATIGRREWGIIEPWSTTRCPATKTAPPGRPRPGPAGRPPLPPPRPPSRDRGPAVPPPRGGAARDTRRRPPRPALDALAAAARRRRAGRRGGRRGGGGGDPHAARRDADRLHPQPDHRAPRPRRRHLRHLRPPAAHHARGDRGAGAAAPGPAGGRGRQLLPARRRRPDRHRARRGRQPARRPDRRGRRHADHAARPRAVPHPRAHLPAQGGGGAARRRAREEPQQAADPHHVHEPGEPRRTATTASPPRPATTSTRMSTSSTCRSRRRWPGSCGRRACCPPTAGPTWSASGATRCCGACSPRASSSVRSTRRRWRRLCAW